MCNMGRMVKIGEELACRVVKREQTLKKEKLENPSETRQCSS